MSAGQLGTAEGVQSCFNMVWDNWAKSKCALKLSLCTMCCFQFSLTKGRMVENDVKIVSRGVLCLKLRCLGPHGM